MSTPPLAEETIALVGRWLAQAAADKHHADPSAARLARLLKDPQGLDFTIAFVDRVIRPEDTRVAGRNLRTIARHVPLFLAWHLRIAVKLGGFFAVLMPWLVVPTARAVLRRMVSHLIIDARPEKLGKQLRKLRAEGTRLNLNLLGEAVLGEGEAARRLVGTHKLLERPDVDYVSVKVSSIASQLSLWAFDDTVNRVVEYLTPLYEVAAAAEGQSKFINLDMEEYRDLDLTIEVFTKILDKPAFKQLEAGIVLQAYLPDALGAMQQLQAWSAERRAAGGAPVKVRLVKGANLAMEHVDAVTHGWPQATFGSKQDTDTNYKRVLDWAMTPERVDAVRLGVAGHNLFDIAYAWLLAGERSVRDGVEFEMLLGMASAQAAAVRGDVGGLLLYTPVVLPSEFDVAISYLIRRLEENASQDNFMSAIFELTDDRTLFQREQHRFVASLESLYEADSPPVPHRNQDRRNETYPTTGAEFHNTPDTDPSVPGNRAWAAAVLERSTDTQMGTATLEANSVPGPASLESIIQRTRRAGADWAARGSEIRAWHLHQCAASLASRRGALISVMAAETGKTIAEADVEVSEAIDFANYYAESARRLDAVDGARFTPSRLIVVTPPWNFPVAIPAGGVLSSLASGSAVIIKPAHQARRCAAVMVEALWEAGIPRDVLQLVNLTEGALGQALISHKQVDRVILTGAWDTAKLFRSWRPDLPLLAETSGKNAIIVTPSADIDQAAADIAHSTFGHAGQKCSAASLAILVGSVATSARFRRQLVDAVKSQVVGYPEDPEVFMGPVIEPVQGKLATALTELGDGEQWLLQPSQLDDSGRLWSPGIRIGVKPGSHFHLTEFFGPVLGIMQAGSLKDAIAFQNATDFGLTAGLHSLDADEAELWIDSVRAGNLYVNRSITGAIVQRQPFGGWKRSSVGATAKAGGPNYVVHLGSWEPAPLRNPHRGLTLSSGVSALLDAARQGVDDATYDYLTSAAQSDQSAWEREFGILKDVAGLGVERNIFRYLPTPVEIRHEPNAPIAELLRVLLAAKRTNAPITVSVAEKISGGLNQSIHVESKTEWLARMKTLSAARVRLIGADASALSAAVDGNPDIAIHAEPVTASGRIELLPFLREQAVSITAHRFGNPDPAFTALMGSREA